MSVHDDKRLMVAVYGAAVESTVDGPGTRAVVHFAGCSRGCPGCFNTRTHDRDAPGVRWVEPGDLAEEILSVSSDVTISGGEPLEQVDALLALLWELVRLVPDLADLSVVLYSGWTRARIESEYPREWADVVDYRLVDVLIDGPFVRDRLAETGTRGSDNQVVHLLSGRYREIDFAERGAEVTLAQDGSVLVLGFPDEELLSMLGVSC